MAGKVTYTPFISKSFPESEAIKPIPISFSNLTPRGVDPDREVIPIQYQSVTKEEPKKDGETPFTWAKLVLNSKPKGSHQFKTSDIQVGQMQDFLDTLAKNNIFVRVTSGIRKGAITSNGNVSNHDKGLALDITPIEGETWEQLIDKMKNSKEVRDFMRNKGIRILDERTDEVLAKTGGTGAHFHVSYGKTEGKSADEFFV